MLLTELPTIAFSSHNDIFIKIVGISIVGVDLFVIFFGTGNIRVIVVGTLLGFGGSRLAHIRCGVNMRQSALCVTTRSCVSVVRTLGHMTLGTMTALVTIAQRGKVATYRCRRTDVKMSITTVRLGTVAAGEMGTGRNAIRSGIMREIASFLTGGAFAVTQVILADCKLVDIVSESAAVALRA